MKNQGFNVLFILLTFMFCFSIDISAQLPDPWDLDLTGLGGGLGGGSTTSIPSISIGNIEGCPGDVVSIPVIASNFDGLQGMQFRIHFSNEWGNLNISANSTLPGFSSGNFNLNSNRLSVSWNNPFGSCTTIQNFTLLNLTVEIPANATGCINITPDASFTEFSNCQFNVFPINLNSENICIDNNCSDPDEPCNINIINVNNTDTALDCEISVSVNANITGDCGAITYQWNWGDGHITYGGASNSHTYGPNSSSPISICVKVIGNGDWDVDCTNGSLHCDPLEPDDNTSTSRCAMSIEEVVQSNNDNCTKKFEAIISCEENCHIEYIWNFGDGIIESSETPIVSHTYQSNGRYVGTLTTRLKDNLDCTSSTGMNVLVDNCGAGIVVPSTGFNTIPNPAKNNFTLRYSFPEKSIEGKMVLVNVQGKQVFQKRLYPDAISESIDVSSLPRGVYFIRVQADGKTVNQSKVVLTN